MFRKLFGGRNKSEENSTPLSDGTLSDSDPRIELGYARVKAEWDLIGPTDANVITYLINPEFQGKPGWPNMRQAFRIVRPPDSLIIASDGLADPFVGSDNTDEQSFGCEVYIEAPELVGRDFQGLRDSWAFRLIENFAMNIADWGGLSHALKDSSVLSFEMPAKGVLPDRWLAPSGNAGCLINVPAPGRPQRIADMPFGAVDIIALTLITPEELERVVEGGGNARRALAAELAAQGLHNTSRLDRI